MKVIYVPDDFEVVITQKKEPSYTCKECIHFCQHWAPDCGVSLLTVLEGSIK